MDKNTSHASSEPAAPEYAVIVGLTTVVLRADDLDAAQAEYDRLTAALKPGADISVELFTLKPQEV